jgi:hypothetical protein
MTRAPVTAGWDEVLERVGDERGLPHMPPEVREAVMGAASLAAAVAEDVCHRVPDREGRRWVAAALAALAHQVQLSTLPPPRRPLDEPAPARGDDRGRVIPLVARARTGPRP